MLCDLVRIYRQFRGMETSVNIEILHGVTSQNAEISILYVNERCKALTAFLSCWSLKPLILKGIILGSFEKLRKGAISFVMSACLSVRLSVCPSVCLSVRPSEWNN
jgi:hypothetical protein